MEGAYRGSQTLKMNKESERINNCLVFELNPSAPSLKTNILSVTMITKEIFPANQLKKTWSTTKIIVNTSMMTMKMWYKFYAQKWMKVIIAIAIPTAYGDQNGVGAKKPLRAVKAHMKVKVYFNKIFLNEF